MKSTDELINDLKKQDQTSFLENETDYVQSGGAYLSKLDSSAPYRLLSTAVPIGIPAHAVHLPACYPVSEEPV